MHACGIICEYNPFHNGHLFQIDMAKQKFGLPVVCVMSGDFVQRGEYALYDKGIRANWAIKAGANLVLELPFPYSSMTAEIFARSGVALLEQSGLCDRILFGSESDDLDMLTTIAKADDNADVKTRVVEIQKSNRSYGFAKARQKALEEFLEEKDFKGIQTPNDILGIEYIKAIHRSKSNLKPFCIKREGASHHSGESGGNIASATHIRSLLRSNSLQEIKNYVPEWVYEDMQSTPYRELSDNLAILCALMLLSPAELKEYAEIGGGLEFKISKAAKESDTLSELYEKIKNKSLTDAKVRRAVLFAFLKVEKETMKQMPLYTNILAFDETGRELLKQAKDKSSIILASRIADIKKNEKAFSQFQLAERAKNVFEKLQLNQLNH
jgi:Predicted nucleotidyltransferase